MGKYQRVRIGLTIGFMAVVAMLFVVAVMGCAHKQTNKPYTALDYAKVTLNNLNNAYQVAVAVVPEMKTFPDPKVREAYPKTLEILSQAGEAILLYTDAVQLWEVSGVRPPNIDELQQKAQALVNDAMNLLIEFGVLK